MHNRLLRVPSQDDPLSMTTAILVHRYSILFLIIGILYTSFAIYRVDGPRVAIGFIFVITGIMSLIFIYKNRIKWSAHLITATFLIVYIAIMIFSDNAIYNLGLASIGIIIALTTLNVKYGILNAILVLVSLLISRIISILDIHISQGYYQVSPIYTLLGFIADTLFIIFYFTTLRNSYQSEFTARKQKEDEYRILLETIPQAVVETEIGGKILFGNQATSRLFGESNKKLVGQNIYEFISNFEDMEGNGIDINNFKDKLTFTSPYVATLHTSKYGLRTIQVNWAFKKNKNEQPIGIISVISDITEDQIKKNQIQQNLREKELLLKEIHHRVKNNLEIVSSLAFLELQTTQTKPPKEIIHGIKNKIFAISNIYDGLDKSGTNVEINVRENIENFVENLISTYHDKDFNLSSEFSIEDCYLDIDKSISLNLIINELVTNSIKHAFKGMENESLLKLTIQKINHEKFLFTYEDNGLGFSVDKLKNHGIGIRIIESLSNQIGTNPEYRNENGFKFLLTIITSK